MHHQEGLRRTGGALLALSAVALAAAAAALGPPADAAELPKRLLPEQYRARVVAPKKGRVLLVNFWATWCEPCRKEMPALVSAARTFARKDLAVVLVSVDTRKTSSAIPAFLQQNGVSFSCWVARSPDPQKFIDTVDPRWDGSLPYTVIYGRTGEAVVTLSGAQTDTSFIGGIRRALSR